MTGGSSMLAVRHALGWLVCGNAVGLYLALLVLFPDLQSGELSYGRWVPVHLNVQLYGWTSLPLVAWLLSIYQVDAAGVASWASAAVWAWSVALALGVVQWLGGISSGKVFLDWKSGALWAFIAAQAVLWCVLAAAWRERSRDWPRFRRYASLAGLAGLALVPVSLIFAASPSVYPPVDRTTGGPTGSSLLGSSLVVVGLMLMLPRVLAVVRTARTNRGVWWFFGVSWLVFGVTEAMGGTHRDLHQIGSMLFLLPWVWLLPRDWTGFTWPAESRAWRLAMFGWWGILVITGLLMYQPGVLDRLKFTQGLVAHSHLAMAGFTTSFCALLAALLTGKRIGGGMSILAWHLAVFVMIATLAAVGWREGAEPSWMLARPDWREWGFIIRAASGAVITGVSLAWWWEWRRS